MLKRSNESSKVLSRVFNQSDLQNLKGDDQMLLCKDCGKKLDRGTTDGLCDACFMIHDHEKYLAAQAGIPVSDVGSLFEAYAKKNKSMGDDQMLCPDCGSTNINFAIRDDVLLYLSCLDCDLEYTETSGLYDQYVAEMESDFDDDEWAYDPMYDDDYGDALPSEAFGEEKEELTFKEARVLCFIDGGVNKSTITIKEFLRCVEKNATQYDPEDDYVAYVMDEFCHDNGIEFYKYSSLASTFLGIDPAEDVNEDVYEEEEYEEGPYGGAFSSWDDFWNWKER